ncbi:alternative ribosome rescue aminoacyl-tRNA hydrolase ArfB [Nocardioides bizhenqiangii]|uniref:Alternative ribosome rescue aminoacyl-tRNA hydrolase ArfB n=1 Tax=Nocardioides bizhenqiangii TaxID=3095076 RepID=A0ABZ0ZMC0_9ACTN|nr:MULTISPECIES: alternative ribosome rescue aminoacyl-tRNA hydrolase ArfB [unclassified Nocardioides]MDZ5620722.1 alternative ribosome rescue aminoacyl-tRNA hydrolase ArfB [Nocardioides sp. HM23]WQQ25086.1 alternative ribosome rescue aminoacyl-tRNA hydrolase ArfB [Nocardioides sp. HM61]
MAEPGQDLPVPPGPGLPSGATIPAGELVERFSRSPGPGGQAVNTSDTRVELLFAPGSSTAFTDAQRARLVRHLADAMTRGHVSVVASEHRSQLRNRIAARERLVALLREAVAPPPPPRRKTKPSRASQRRRVEEKKQRGRTKTLRGPVRDE